VYSSPEDAVFEQDAKSRELADKALLWCTGAQRDRLSQLVDLDLSGLGVSVSRLALVCNSTRTSKSLRSLTLNQCALLDHEQITDMFMYNELRAALIGDGVSIADASDVLDIRVITENVANGWACDFKLPGRRRLKTLFAVFSVRMNRDFRFYYKRRIAPDEGIEEVTLHPSDSPRRIGMVPQFGSTKDGDKVYATIVAR
jgi:hypothetical protein